MATGMHNLGVATGLVASSDPGDQWYKDEIDAYHCAVKQRSYIEAAEFFVKYMLGRGITVKTVPPPSCGSKAA
jgi:hypothetical protein